MWTSINSMRSFLFSIALALTAVGVAQMDPFDYHCADVVLLQAKPVQVELTVNEAQRKKMNDAAETHRTRLTTYEAQQKAAKVKDTRDQAQVKLKGYFDELKRGVFGSLTATQLKRLRELTLQRAGLLALLDEKVATKIGLTGAPYTKFRTTFSDGAKQAQAIERTNLKPIFDKYEPRMRAAKSDADRKSIEGQMRPELEAAGKKIAPQIQKLQADTQQRLVAMLTATQKSAWQALLGKPYKPSN
jgi:hypothetical protein